MPARNMADRPDESCPVCKQSTYLNPNMKFKINPDCYHRMCDSCIDRIFGHGPAPCPVAGCKRTLRKAKFRTQTFADLSIERECDIRKRVGSILNQVEHDFESLRAFNDYQERKETLIWNLISGEDVVNTEKQLRQYQQQNAASISKNHEDEVAARKEVNRQEQLRLQRAEEGRQDLARELADEKAAKGQQLKGIVDSVMSAKGDPEEAARQARQRVQQQRSTAIVNDRTAAQKTADAQRLQGGPVESLQSSASGSGLSFAGLRQEVKKEIKGPYDAFEGTRVVYKNKMRKDNDYTNDKLQGILKGFPAAIPSGFSHADYYKHLLFDAHAGLGLIAGKNQPTSVT